MTDQSPELPAATQAPNTLKRPVIALLLSLLAPGLGQFYNRQNGKACVVGVVLVIVYTSGGLLGGFHQFTSFFVLLFFLISWQVGAAFDAVVTARTQTIHGLPALQIGRHLRFGAALLVLGPPVFLASYPPFFDRVLRFHAYRVPSASGCPTVCAGERMIVDPSAYRISSPQRGDLVMFRHPLFDSLLFKRVVALPGDVVTQSNEGVLVNGRPAALVDLTRVCGNPPGRDRSDVPIPSKSVAVPADSLYVVGDNWSNSFDSRMQEFGFVPIKSVRGRPLFLYWSPYRNRIGCHLR